MNDIENFEESKHFQGKKKKISLPMFSWTITLVS